MDSISLKTIKTFFSTLTVFLKDLDKGDVSCDEEMLDNFKIMSRTLQRILSRQSQTNSRSTIKTEPVAPSICNTSVVSIEATDFLNGTSILEFDSPLLKSKHTIPFRDIPASGKTSKNKTDLDLDITMSMVDRYVNKKVGDDLISHESETEEDIRSLKSESISQYTKSDNDITETDIAEGILQITKDTYSCKICNVERLSPSNLKSHLTGRQHKNNSEKYESESGGIEETIAILKMDYRQELLMDAAGADYIIAGKKFRCKICKADLSGIECIRQHIIGIKHKKLCEQ